jgi:hypothetical protein
MHPAIEAVVAVLSIEIVVVLVTKQRIGPAPAQQGVELEAPDEPVAPVAACERVRTAVAAQPVAAGRPGVLAAPPDRMSLPPSPTACPRRRRRISLPLPPTDCRRRRPRNV